MTLDLGRRSIVEWTGSAPGDAAPEVVPAQEKFAVETVIGSGGMGEVFVVTDRDLKRQVAMKILRHDVNRGPEQRMQFVAEAQATSQLEHQGVPPVHDIGLAADGRPYFTMKLVRGRTLREVLRDLVLKRRGVQREYTLHRLVTILERIAEALEFAHARGVVHRDLKPENIMLGDYGEVHLMDWGLACVVADPTEDERVETSLTAAGLRTQYGALSGTLPYMSPEQACGGPVDGRTDLFALGCVLYEALTLHPAFDPQDERLLVNVQTAHFPDVATRDPRRTIPAALVQICRRSMARSPEDRYGSAAEMREALRGWLDGRAERERSHAEAEALAARGKEAAANHKRLEAEIDHAEAAAQDEAARYQPFQPVSEKRSLVQARKRVETLRTEVALAFAEATHLFNAALTHERDNATARAALTRLWLDRLADAERRGDPVDSAHALAMAGRYAGGPIASDGSLVLTSEPAGADVILSRFEEVDGVLESREEKHLGRTPLGPVPLAMGSYLCVLRKEGFRDTRYPVLITRERAWEGKVTLRTDGEIGEHFVYVPAGPFRFGEGKDASTRDLPDFAIARYPVTFGEYARFLDALDDQEAEKRSPHTQNETYMERGPGGRWQPAKDLLDDKTRATYRERHGPGFEVRLPVFGVSWEDASAYCAWKTKATGREWRLPTEQEREKAARGVDGRSFAWGDLADASLGKCSESRAEVAQPEPVGAFPTARSVYGMGDASGSMWDWTDSWFDEHCAARVVRGGSWSNTVASGRCAFRGRDAPGLRDTRVGFRCARSL